MKVLAAFLLMAFPALAAEYSVELVRACAPDAHRLCAVQVKVHDIAAIKLCMEAKASSVSRRCRIVWKASGQ
jgi:hypothetical protein